MWKTNSLLDKQQQFQASFSVTETHFYAYFCSLICQLTLFNDAKTHSMAHVQSIETKRNKDEQIGSKHVNKLTHISVKCCNLSVKKQQLLAEIFFSCCGC